MPAAPETVAVYLAWRAGEVLSPASLRMDRPAIRYRHTEAGQPTPPTTKECAGCSADSPDRPRGRAVSRGRPPP